MAPTAAVEGTAREWGAALSGIARTRYGGSVRLPVLLRGFANTPVDRAFREMVDAAVTHVVEKTPPAYFRAPGSETDTGPRRAHKHWRG